MFNRSTLTVILVLLVSAISSIVLVLIGVRCLVAAVLPSFVLYCYYKFKQAETKNQDLKELVLSLEENLENLESDFIKGYKLLSLRQRAMVTEEFCVVTYFDEGDWLFRPYLLQQANNTVSVIWNGSTYAFDVPNSVQAGDLVVMWPKALTVNDMVHFRLWGTLQAEGECLDGQAHWSVDHLRFYIS
jgi:hypothetical protein